MPKLLTVVHRPLSEAGRLDLEPIFERAVEAATKAHAPYSRFHVGAAVADDTGAVFVGCNVENAAYPIGTCAERNALGALVVGRVAGARPTSLALVGFAGGSQLAPCTPCGACRQAIVELNRDCQVHFLAGRHLSLHTSLARELLPLAFEV